MKHAVGRVLAEPRDVVGHLAVLHFDPDVLEADDHRKCVETSKNFAVSRPDRLVELVDCFVDPVDEIVVGPPGLTFCSRQVVELWWPHHGAETEPVWSGQLVVVGMGGGCSVEGHEPFSVHLFLWGQAGSVREAGQLEDVVEADDAVGHGSVVVQHHNTTT